MFVIIRIFDAFAGIGALEKALHNIGISHEVTCMSEIDIDAIISYGAIRNLFSKKEDNFTYPIDEEMKKYLKDRNIGTDFKTNKNKIDKLKKEKLKQCYKVSKIFNNLGDISKIKTEDIPEFDLMNFSFSCQDLSIAGKQQGLGEGTRSGLYVYGINIIKHKKPKYVMIENVKNLIQKKFINDFYSIIKEIEDLGYNCYYPQKNGKPTCLNSKNYNIPQNRERIFVICIRKDIDNHNFEFNFGTPCTCTINDFLEEQVDEKYYINTGRANKLINILISKNKLPLSQKQFPCDSSINTPQLKEISNCITARYDAGIQNQKSIGLAVMERVEDNKVRQVGNIVETGNFKNSQRGRIYDKQGISPTLNTVGGGGLEPKIIVDNKINKIGGLYGNHQAGSVYDTNGICSTIDTMQGGNREPCIVSNFRIRKLTPKECWRLMGFADEDIDKCINADISNSQLYKQAGNSIVVNVLESIFKNLFNK